MPLPDLRAVRLADAALAREHTKRVLLGADPAEAAAQVGGPLPALRDHPAAIQLAGAVGVDEAELLQETAAAAPSVARAALESREGRVAWLAGVMTGEIRFEGAFGHRKAFPPQARMAAARLLGLMHGDYVTRHEVTVDEQAIVVFHVPDNGRLPESSQIVDALPEGT